MLTIQQRLWPVVALAARVAVGAVFIFHGLGKYRDLGGTAGMFEQIGVPMPDIAAAVATAVEVLGGAFLVLGALLPVVGTLLALQMAGAWWFVHRTAGLYASDGGYEFVMVLGAAALLIGFSGGGALAVDRLFTRMSGRDSSRYDEQYPVLR